MSFITSNKDHIVLSGKDNLYILKIRGEPTEVVTLNLAKVRPSKTSGQKEGTTPSEKISLVCAGISADSTYISASDSDKNVFLYKKDSVENVWSLLSIFQTEKRLLKIQFTQKLTHLVMTDKCGDVFVRELVNEDENVKLQKILGHCSVILDTCLNASNTEIFTSDRDEKIRVSSFPDAYNIKGYYLGHKEAVLFIALVHDDTHLVSLDIESNMKVWKVENKACAITFNLFSLLNLPQADAIEPTVDYQVRFARVTEVNKKVYVALRTSYYNKLAVFDFDLESLTTQLVGTVPMETNEFDFCWVGTDLYVISPDINTGLGKVSLGNHDKLSEFNVVSINGFDSIADDVRLFVKFNEVTNIPLRKRVGYEGPEKNPPTKVRVIENTVITDPATC